MIHLLVVTQTDTGFHHSALCGITRKDKVLATDTRNVDCEECRRMMAKDEHRRS